MDRSGSQATRIGGQLCLAGAVLGAVGLIGCLTATDVLTRMIPGQPMMMPNTCIGLLLLGLAGALLDPERANRAVQLLSVLAGVVVLIIGAVTIAEYVPGLPFSIDQLVVQAQGEPYPGRPSPPTALALTLLAAAVLTSKDTSARRVHLSELLILCAGFIAFTIAIEQLLGANGRYQIFSVTVVGVAVPTALGLLLISLGLLAKNPASQLVRIVTSSDPGSMMLRRLVPALILIGVSLAFTGALLTDIVGSENLALLRAGLTVFGIAVVLPLFFFTARQLNRTHEALKRSEGQYRELIALASDGIFVADLEGRFTEVNDAGCRLLGLSREEIVGKTIMDFILPEDKERLFSHRERFLKGDTDLGEWMLRRKDGTYLPVEVSAKILPDGRWLAIDRDISERKRAEETIWQVQERWYLALKGANLGSWDWNIATGEVVSNARCAEMRGFRPEEITPHVDAYLADMHPDDRPAFKKALDECFDGTRPEFECEYRSRTKDGGWVWILSQGNVFSRDEQGRPKRMVGTALDLTPRKRTEDALRQAQERLDLALKGAGQGSWDWNIVTGEVILSPRCAEMRGYQPQERRAQWDSWISGMHPDDLPAVRKIFGECTDGIRSEFECEFRVPTKSGDWIWMLTRGKAVSRDEQGRPTRMAGTGLDITSRKRAEEALRLSEAKFSGIVSMSADAIISIDEDLNIALFNEASERVFGWSKADVVGKPVSILIPERLRTDHAQKIHRFEAAPETTRRLGGIREAEIYGLRSNGEEFPIDASVSKIVIDGRHILTMVLRDITEEKRLEREQRLLAELGSGARTLEFEDCLTNLADLTARDLADICIVDVVEDNGSIRRARVATLDSEKELLCDALTQLRFDGNEPLLKQVLEHEEGILIQSVTPDVLRAWGVNEGDLAAFHSASIQSAIIAPLPARGKVLGLVSLLSFSRAYSAADLRVIERMAERAALVLDNARLFAAAKRATQAREEMLGIVAHDLRNPLTAITTLAAVLQSGPEREVGGEITYAAGRMNHLIRDLIDVARLETGRLTAEQERLAPDEILSQMLHSQKPLATSASLELRLEAESNLPEIWADRDRLLQIFENLISNAIKFTGRGGCIKVGARAREDEVLFWVADNGRGIANMDLPHVFDRFWQEPGAKRRGLGFGLAIVRGIVEAHNGRVWAQSTPGQGSTFFFTIPAAPPARAGATMRRAG